ncbi:MAG: dTDP-4-dehydrorhamnose 3,5-epimerase [Sulfuritalea sp.]|jgi:dTDP-4-dehydrorhamnose 3,5-epimerase|nr:dTDP-4-dehydrorhamnose 3,5-epimerase [Sulfuritalea sp.]
MFEVRECAIAGCYEIDPKVFVDSRGQFVKVFQTEEFSRRGLDADFREEFYTISTQGVIRGLHFQAPPMDQTKMVYCVSGSVLDVVVDLRMGSPTYGSFAQFELNADKPGCIYIPKGLAHGFCVLSASATLIYKVTRSYAPEYDEGIAWNSVGIPWPVSDPVLSERDRRLTPFTDFRSPFVHGM